MSRPNNDTSNQRKRRHPQADVVANSSTSSQHHQNNNGSCTANGSASAILAFGSGPRSLDVLEFAESRAREIASLTHILSVGSAPPSASGSSTSNPSQVSGGGRRVFQSLPRHMRRRAMSHNIKRLPGRLQAAAKREMDKIEKSSNTKQSNAAANDDGDSTTKKKSGPSRRTRRRPRNILGMHAHRMMQHQWLETHIWHAKRMYMENAWGYKMATRPTDRSLRACYNANVHLATIFDASARQVLAIQGPDVKTIATFLRRYIYDPHWHEMQSPSLISGHREGELHFHQPGAAPYGFITTIKYQWQGVASLTHPSLSATKQLWLWLHPSVYALIQFMLESALTSSSTAAPSSISIVPLLGQLCRIELRGHRCQAVLRMAIRAVETKKKEGTAAAAASNEKKEDVEMNDASSSSTTPSPSIASLLTAYVSPALFPAHAIYPYQVQHPEKLHPSPHQPFEFREGAMKEKMKGPIMPKRNNTFSKSTDQTMATQLSLAHHQYLHLSSLDSTPLVSPLFDADFRRRHTRETAWGTKKQRYTRIATKEIERKRKMHERRREEKMKEAVEEDGAMSDTTTLKRTKTPTKASGTKAKPRSKDDLDVGTSATPLPSSQPIAASLTNQPYIMLIQQPGVNLQCTADQPKTHINSPAHSLGSGWDIICSSGWCVLLWKALIYSGARAIGHEDRTRFLHELGQFDSQEPFDHPDTHAGQIAALFRQRTRMWHSERIPTNKKPNYHRNHVAYPFTQPFFELLELGKQTELEAKYEECIRKAKKLPSGEVANHADEATITDVVPAGSHKTKKQKLDDQTERKESDSGDIEMSDIPDAETTTTSTIATPSTATKSSSKSKPRPRPDTEPPFELFPVPVSFASQHIPFFVWRHWRREYEGARKTEPNLDLVQFLTSSQAPPLGNVLLPVSMICRTGGVPEDDSFICAPLLDEWTRFRTQTPPIPLQPIVPSLDNENTPVPWNVLNERNNHIHTPPHPLRVSIGYVLHGWFSYQHGSGQAFGYVAAEPFIQLMKQQLKSSQPINSTDMMDTNTDSSSPTTFVTPSATSPSKSSSMPSIWVWNRNQNSLAYRAAEISLM